MAIRNVRRLQEEFDKTERPDFRLRRDLADARAYLEAVKAKDKVKRKTNRAERIRAQLVEAEEEANRAFEVATETSRAAEKTKKAANASRQGTYILKLIVSMWPTNRVVSRFSREEYASYVKTSSCFSGSNFCLRSKETVSTLQTCLMVLVINHVFKMKTSFPPHRFAL